VGQNDENLKADVGYVDDSEAPPNTTFLGFDECPGLSHTTMRTINVAPTVLLQRGNFRTWVAEEQRPSGEHKQCREAED